MKRGWILVLVVGIVVSGCLIAAPRVRYFEVRPEPPARQDGPALPSVMVPNFSCLAAYDHLRVVQRQSEVEVVTTRNLQWTTVPGRMLAQGLRVYLEATGRFETVRRSAKPRPPYTVEGQVQVIEVQQSPVAARLGLHINVRRAAGAAVIGEEFVDETLEADGRDPADGVLALRTLWERILEDLSAKIIAAIEADVARQAPPKRPAAAS